MFTHENHEAKTFTGLKRLGSFPLIFWLSTRSIEKFVSVFQDYYKPLMLFIGFNPDSFTVVLHLEQSTKVLNLHLHAIHTFINCAIYSLVKSEMLCNLLYRAH